MNFTLWSLVHNMEESLCPHSFKDGLCLCLVVLCKCAGPLLFEGEHAPWHHWSMLILRGGVCQGLSMPAWELYCLCSVWSQCLCKWVTMVTWTRCVQWLPLSYKCGWERFLLMVFDFCTSNTILNTSNSSVDLKSLLPQIWQDPTWFFSAVLPDWSYK